MNRAISPRASIAILSAFSSIRRARLANAARSQSLARLLLGDAVRDTGGDLAREARLAHHDCQQRGIHALQVADEVRLDAISREPHRASLQQGFSGRDAQNGLEKIDRRVTTKHMVKALTKSYSVRRRGTHGRWKQLATAQLEETAVTNSVARRPVEYIDRATFGDAGSQQLARPVPIDQEDERRPDRFEKSVAKVIGGVPASDEIERTIVTEPLGTLAIEPAPLNGKIPQQTDKELRPRQMHVGIGHRHRVNFR